MNIPDFTNVLKHPSQITTPEQVKQLDDIIEEYPFFQAARAMRLKGLKTIDSFKYNNALKITAAYTSDREVLFDFITSKAFLQNDIATTLKTETNKEDTASNTPESVVPNTLEEAEQILDETLFVPKPESETQENHPPTPIVLGTPLNFNQNEKHSFAEWLQLAQVKKIQRNDDASANPAVNNEKQPTEKSVSKKRQQKKFEQIATFIENNPKIVPNKNTSPKVDITSSLTLDKEELMTETLATVYLEQKKYKKAIQAYKILSLKYPEKNSFFADRIKGIEELQKDNT